VHLSTTTMYLNPDIPAAHDLKQWYLLPNPLMSHSAPPCQSSAHSQNNTTHRWQSQSLQGATQASSYGSSRQFPARGKHKAEAVKTIQEIKALDVSVPTRLLNPHPGLTSDS
jgi:hypothetical protein